MKAANPWITYRTRFLIKAKQLNNSLAFTDILGRQHSGCKGDYLVESSEGLLTIAPRQIFEDIYVPLLFDHPTTQINAQNSNCFINPEPHDTAQPRKTSQFSEPLRRRQTILPLPPTFIRKTVQPYRDQDPSAPSVGSV